MTAPLSLTSLLAGINPATPLRYTEPFKPGDTVILVLENPLQRGLAVLAEQLIDQMKESEAVQEQILAKEEALIRVCSGLPATQAWEDELENLGRQYEEQEEKLEELSAQASGVQEFLFLLIRSEIKASGQQLPEHGLLLKGDGNVVAKSAPKVDPQMKQMLKSLLSPFFGSILGRPDCDDPNCPGCSARRGASENKEPEPAQAGPVAEQVPPPPAEVEGPAVAEEPAPVAEQEAPPETQEPVAAEKTSD